MFHLQHNQYPSSGLISIFVAIGMPVVVPEAEIASNAVERQISLVYMLRVDAEKSFFAHVALDAVRIGYNSGRGFCESLEPLQSGGEMSKTYLYRLSCQFLSSEGRLTRFIQCRRTSVPRFGDFA
jgi:hypothetical protein